MGTFFDNRRMPHRDPSTGQFVASSSVEDVEIVSFGVPISVAASTLDGATDSFYGEQATFEGELLYDLDQIVDRHEVGELLRAEHRAVIQPTGTQTADSAAFLVAEIGASPSLKLPGGVFDAADDQAGDFTINTILDHSDTVDLVGRPLVAMAQGPFTDGTNNLGGGGGPGDDSLELSPIGFDMDRRDEMYLSGKMGAQNISDGPVTAYVIGRHVYEIRHS